jgi:hypothetical protein
VNSIIPEYCIAGSTSCPTVLRRWKLNCWKTTTTVHDLRRDVHLGKGIQSTLHVVVVIAVKALHKCLEDFRPVLAIALLHHGTDNNGNSCTHLLVTLVLTLFADDALLPVSCAYKKGGHCACQILSFRKSECIRFTCTSGKFLGPCYKTGREASMFICYHPDGRPLRLSIF